VIDFGSLKPVKQWLCDTFDHKTLIAEDDPSLPFFKEMESLSLIDLIVVPATGCEGFAKYIYDNVNRILFEEGADLQGGMDNGVFLATVTVREHGANSATYTPDIGKRRR
jgi:6-pyruvoyltetrahydropterin/6-carboxytetrahydropterin synthase